MSALLIQNGVVVNATGEFKANVLIEDGRIVAMGSDVNGSRKCSQVINAEGMQLIPGGIDPHVHLSPFVDDFQTASKAALAGGITTIGVMSFPDKGESIRQMLQRFSLEADAHASVDVLLHGVLNLETAPEPEVLSDIVAAGQTTCKIFTILGNFDGDYLRYATLMRKARELRILPLFHCEDSNIMQESLRILKDTQRVNISHYEESRPVLSEELSVQKVLALGELTGCPVYVVHVSSARALAACEAARLRGIAAYVETRPIYLHFESRKYKSSDGPLYVSFPPIRSSMDKEALWQGLLRGAIHTIGSDHAPWRREQKLDPTHCYVDNPLPGMSNLQEMLPILYSEGVSSGRLSLNRFVEVSSTNAAKLLGIYPRKGVIAVGSDADIVIWDPDRTMTIRSEDGYSRADFSLYEGWKVTGVPRTVIRLGQVAFSDGEFAGECRPGRVLRRAPAFDSSIYGLS